MSTNDLIAAAKCILDDNSVHAQGADYECGKMLARELLAANPVDNAEQVTSTWLASVLGPSMRGAINGSQDWYVQFWETQPPSIVFRRNEYREEHREDEVDLPNCETRGAVRILCRVLNIPLVQLEPTHEPDA